jgi:hypothetical protein
MIIAFALGVVAGFVLAVLAAIVFLNLPEPKRLQPPVKFAAIGAGSVHTSRPVGAVPEDWQPIFRPNHRS